jgi:hypothetical protein
MTANCVHGSGDHQMTTPSGAFPDDLGSQAWQGTVLWSGYARIRQHYKGDNEEMPVHIVIRGSPDGPDPTLLAAARSFVDNVDSYRLSASQACECFYDGEGHLCTAEFFYNNGLKLILELDGYGKPSTPRGPLPVVVRLIEFDFGDANYAQVPSSETLKAVWCARNSVENA